MDKNKIAVVGDPSSVMIFKAVGFDVFYEQEPDQIKRRLHTLADEGYVDGDFPGYYSDSCWQQVLGTWDEAGQGKCGKSRWCRYSIQRRVGR